MGSIDFKALFQSSPNPYVLLDPSFALAEMNDAYLQATMRTREEIVGRNMFEAFPSDPSTESHRQLRSSLERVVREKARDHLPLIKYDLTCPDGSVEERYWSATHTPLFDEAGEVAFVLQHTVDITEMQRLRARLRAAPGGSAQIESGVLHRAAAVQEQNRALSAESEQLRSLFNQAPGFVAVLWGPEHVFVMANAAYHRLVGRSALNGRKVAEAMPEVVAQGFVDRLNEVYASCKPFVGQGERVTLQHNPGAEPEERYVDFVFQPLAGADGATTGIFVQGHDVTEQKRAESALRESERKFRTIADTMPQIVWSTRADGYHDYYNSRWYEYTGFSCGDSEGAGWNPALHPEDRERASRLWSHCLATGEAYDIEYRFRSKNGDYRWFIGRALPIHDERGRIERWFGTCTDVHELKTAQEQLLESQERAVSAQAETRRLAEALAQRVDELNAANDEIQRFAYIVSHDLRAPLVNIMGFTSELENVQNEVKDFFSTASAQDIAGVPESLRETVETDLSEAIGFIRTSSAKMDRLIAAILKLSREGQRTLSPESIVMRDLFDAQRDQITHQLNERDAEIIVESAPDIVSDRLAVEQIFGNLIDNAVKYLDRARRGRIIIRGTELGAFVRFEVVDNGRGVDPKDFQRIFDLFRRSGVQDQPGEGIGLAHVRALVRRLGGAISVESTPDEGTTFKVLLPRALNTPAEAK